MKKIFALSISLVLLLGSFTFVHALTLPWNECKTKYPLVLVHGAFMRDKNMLGINYWWGIDQTLRNKGAKVYVSNQDPFNGVAPRTQQLANELAYQYKLFLGPLYKFKKINIIGHSMGPLDSRNLISNYAIPGVCKAGACNAKVATLTSISGTHRGSQVGDLLYMAWNGIPILGPIVGETLTSLIDLFGETFEMAPNQNTKLMLDNLRSDWTIKTFNPNTPNKSGVVYEWYAGKINYVNPLVDFLGQSVGGLLYTVMNLMGAGDNDGLVSIDSAKWGNPGKVVPGGIMTTSLLYPGVNHFYEINHILGWTPGWDAKGFYVNVAKNLKARGY